MIGLQMPSCVWRKIIRDKKIDDGNWQDHVEWMQNQGLQPKHKKLGKKRAAETSASSVVANAAAKRRGGSGKAGLLPKGNLPKRARVAGSRKEVRRGLVPFQANLWRPNGGYQDGHFT